MLEVATERLWLHPIHSGDAPELAGIYANPEVFFRFLRPLDEAEHRLERFVQE